MIVRDRSKYFGEEWFVIRLSFVVLLLFYRRDVDSLFVNPRISRSAISLSNRTPMLPVRRWVVDNISIRSIFRSAEVFLVLCKAVVVCHRIRLNNFVRVRIASIVVLLLRHSLELNQSFPESHYYRIQRRQINKQIQSS